MLTKDAILKAQDLNFVTINVPEWGGDVRIKQMSALDRASLAEISNNEKGDIGNQRVMLKLLSLVLVDDQGQPLFNEDDIESLGSKSGNVLNRLANEALKLNAMTKEANEELAGN
jgi:hypothetical protein